MNRFVFTLKDNTRKAFNTFFWFLYFLHLIIAALMVINTTDQLQKKAAVVTFIFMVLTGILFYLFKKRFKLFSYQIAMFITMVVFWLIQSAWLPAVLCGVIIAFVLRVLTIKSTASFTATEIVMVKSLFKKTYAWSDIDNVVLKDDLLSVDLKNNHLIQVEVTGKDENTDETVFNQFAVTNIHLHAKN